MCAASMSPACEVTAGTRKTPCVAAATLCRIFPLRGLGGEELDADISVGFLLLQEDHGMVLEHCMHEYA